MALKYYRFNGLLQKSSWLHPAYVGIDQKGIIQYLSQDAPLDNISMEAVDGFAIAGFQNAHSHAFQYAMAGLAESHPAGTHDDFWSWREAMYRCALSVDPEQAQAIAAMAYTEMLRCGYTSVAEFHYLHHDKDGRPYAPLAEMGARMIAAARTAGIKITLVPVFYQRSNFGQPYQSHQRRFISSDTDDYFRLLDASRTVVERDGEAKLGFSVHSLRAVDLQDVIRTFVEGPKELPFHLHVAEQKKEVDDCLAFCKLRPMAWLLENLDVNRRFHFVHATHLNDDEIKKLTASGAHVVLCPSTEGNLGDGIFRMKDYVRMGGRWSIGTDSHIGLNPLEEFRMMDYRQRLISHQRNSFEGDAAQYLICEEVESGRKAMGTSSKDLFCVGDPLDAVVYDANHPLLGNTSFEHLSGTLVYSPDAGNPLGTIVNGEWIVQRNRHKNDEKIKNDFRMAMRKLRTR